MSRSLRDLRDEQGLDTTLQNLLRALTLSLERRSRYRVFEFEARQDGHAEVAELFGRLRRAESEQTAALLEGLQGQIGATDLTALAERVS